MKINAEVASAGTSKGQGTDFKLCYKYTCLLRATEGREAVLYRAGIGLGLNATVRKTDTETQSPPSRAGQAAFWGL